MAETIVTLTHSTLNGGLPMQIYCTGVTIGLSKKNDKTPNSNYDQYPTDVQSLGRENIKYGLKQCKIDVGDLTYEVVLDLFNLEHDESDPLYLQVKYNSKYLVASDKVSTSIPVTMDGSSSITFSTTTSNNAYMPTLEIPLIEVSTDE